MSGMLALDKAVALSALSLGLFLAIYGVAAHLINRKNIDGELKALSGSIKQTTAETEMLNKRIDRLRYEIKGFALGLGISLDGE